MNRNQDDNIDFTGILQRVKETQSKRLVALAQKPCASCEIESETTNGCEFYERTGCKHLEELERRRKEIEMVRRREANLLRAGLDEKMVKDPFVQMVIRDQHEDRKAMKVVGKALCTPSLRFLVLGGPHRSGKTLAMFKAISIRSDAVYITAGDLGRLNQPHKRWAATQLLCINELGSEHLGGGYSNATLDEMMSEREYGAKLTIFATNRLLQKESGTDPEPSLADRYGDLFVSRIALPKGCYYKCDNGPQPALEAA